MKDCKKGERFSFELIDKREIIIEWLLHIATGGKVKI